MIALAAKLVGPKLAPFAVWGLAIALFAGALWWMRHDAYNDGQRDERNTWELAMAKAREDSAVSAGNASTNAIAREEAFAEKVVSEKAAIEQAQAEGRSPFDVMFPGE